MKPIDRLGDVLISKEKQKQADKMMRIAEKIKKEVKGKNE